MKWKHKYLYSFKLGIQNSFEYRFNFFLSLVGAAFPIIIQYSLWTAIFNSTDQPLVYGYTYAQMIAYSVLAGIIAKLIQTGFEYDVAQDIKEGGLNKYLVKPISYFFYRLCVFVGGKLLFYGLSLLLISLFLGVLYVYTGLRVESFTYLLFMVSLMLAVILNFLIFFCVSTVAFWLIEVSYLFEAARIFVVVLSGGIFPLDILGQGLNQWLSYLPFKYTINYPVNVLNGKLALTEIQQGLLIQCFWIAVCMLLAHWLWKTGARKYVASGG